MLELTSKTTKPKQNDPVVKDVLEAQGITSENVDKFDRLDLQNDIKDQGSWDTGLEGEDEEDESIE